MRKQHNDQHRPRVAIKSRYCPSEKELLIERSCCNTISASSYVPCQQEVQHEEGRQLGFANNGACCSWIAKIQITLIRSHGDVCIQPAALPSRIEAANSAEFESREGELRSILKNFQEKTQGTWRESCACQIDPQREKKTKQEKGRGRHRGKCGLRRATARRACLCCEFLLCEGKNRRERTTRCQKIGDAAS